MQFALAGASLIIISGRKAAPLEETKLAVNAVVPSCTILPIYADVTDRTSVQQLFDRCLKLLMCSSITQVFPYRTQAFLIATSISGGPIG